MKLGELLHTDDRPLATLYVNNYRMKCACKTPDAVSNMIRTYNKICYTTTQSTNYAKATFFGAGHNKSLTDVANKMLVL